MQRSMVLQVTLVAFCFLLFAFCFLLFAFCFLYSAFPCCTSVGGCGVFFWQGKRCLSEASCFSQKKNTPHPAYPPPQQEGWEPKPAAQKPKQDRSAKQEYKLDSVEGERNP